MKPRTIKLLGVQAGRGGRLGGAEDGPYVLRERGLVYRLHRLGHDVDDLGDIPGAHETRYSLAASEGVNHLPNVLQVNRHTHACVLGTLRKSPRSFLLVIGGDHSLAIGTLAGLSDSCKRLGLIWLDAHADFNTPETSPTGNVHGMSLAVACGYGHRDLRMIADVDPLVEEDDVYLLGLRDVDQGEWDNLAETRVRRMTMDEWRAGGITQTVLAAARDLARTCDHVHMSFDIDVIDPTYVRATGTPVPGGLSADEACALLAELSAAELITSAEFVEYNPLLDSDGTTNELTLRLIDTLMATGSGS